MKFTINNKRWQIKELTQEQIIEEYKNHYCKVITEDGRYYGLCWFDINTIILDKNLHIDSKKKTLKHELAHCYIGSYVTYQDISYNEEIVCDLIANSNDFINSIIEKYFKEQ